MSVVCVGTVVVFAADRVTNEVLQKGPVLPTKLYVRF